MNKKLTTVLIALVLLGLLAAVYFMLNNSDDEDSSSETSPNAAENIVLINKDLNDIKMAEFSYGENVTTILPWIDESTNSRIAWQVLDYENVNLNTSKIESMVKPLSHLKSAGKISDNDENLSEYGLDDPNSVATAYYYDGSSITVCIGKMTPQKDYYYIKIADIPGVYLLDAETSEYFFLTVIDMVYTAAPYINFNAVSFVYLWQRNKFEMEFIYSGTVEEMNEEYEANGYIRLTMTFPYKGMEADYINLNDFLYEKAMELTFLNAVEVLPKELSAYGLDDPELVIALRDDVENMYCLYIGSENDDGLFYAMASDRPVVFTVSKEVVEPFLNLEPLIFINRHIAPVYINTAYEIDIDFPEKNRSCLITVEHEVLPEKAEDGSDILKLYPVINGVEVDESSYISFYTTLISLLYDSEIKDYVESADEPLLTIRFKLNNGGDDLVSRYYYYNEDFYAVKVNNLPIQFAVSKHSINLVFEALDREILDVATA